MKTTFIYSAVTFLGWTAAYGQVGINTSTPQTTMDISAKRDTSGNITDNTQLIGLQAPRVTRTELTSNTAVYGTNQKGALLYITDVSGGNAMGTRVNITAPGYYFFDGTAWQKISNGAVSGDTTNDEWVNDPSNGLIKLGKNSDGITVRAAGTDFVAKDNGNIGIGTAAPNDSAILDISASNKGLLIPRVALTDYKDTTTINNPATGLMVYNTGAAALKYEGYVYWNGNEWRSVNNTTTINPTITSLNCGEASVFPTNFVSGTPYSGTLSIPYSGGNGGSYGAGTSFIQNGLTFTQQAGTLEIGNGTVTYSVTGTPNFSSPSTINLNLSFLGQSCTAVVGSNATVKTSTYAYNYFPINANSPTASITTVGNISVRWNYTSLGTGQPFQIRFNDGADYMISVFHQGATPNSQQYVQSQTTDIANGTWTNIPTAGNLIPANQDWASANIMKVREKAFYRLTFQFNYAQTANGTTGRPALPAGCTVILEKMN